MNNWGYSRHNIHRNRRITSEPRQVLEHLGIDIKSINSAGYLVARCPIHNDGHERNPSLNIHSKDGYYRCHACGIAGPSIIKLYMDMTGATWAEAVNYLRSRLC